MSIYGLNEFGWVMDHPPSQCGAFLMPPAAKTIHSVRCLRLRSRLPSPQNGGNERLAKITAGSRVSLRATTIGKAGAWRQADRLALRTDSRARADSMRKRRPWLSMRMPL